jgi:hypothetical protein
VSLFLDITDSSIHVTVVGYAVCRWGLAFIVQLVPLTLAAIFRTTSIMISPNGLHRQHFDFLGGCAKSKPAYTPLRILINRSLSRPLIRCVFISASHYLSGSWTDLPAEENLRDL